MAIVRVALFVSSVKVSLSYFRCNSLELSQYTCNIMNFTLLNNQPITILTQTNSPKAKSTEVKSTSLV